MAARVLTIQVGVLAVKAAVVDVDGLECLGNVGHSGPLAEGSRPEVSVERLWSQVTAAVRQVTCFEDRIDGVALSCFTGGPALLDAADRPLLPIWLPSETCSRSAARQVWADVGQEFLHATGSRPLPGKISAVVFRQQHQQDNYLTHKARTFLDVNGWLAFRMTGEKRFDAAGACATGLFGTLTDREWSQRWCDYFEIERAWLPPVVDADTTVGRLHPSVAAELGIAPGLPVKIGTDETAAAVLAAGLEIGDLLDFQLAGPYQLVTLAQKPVAHSARRVRLLGIGDSFLNVSEDPLGPEALPWVQQLCFHDQSPAQFMQTIELARKRESMVSLEPANLFGSDLEIDARRASLRNLTISADRIDVLAAVLNAIVREHWRARDSIGLAETPRRVYLCSDGVSLFRTVLPEYAQTNVITVEHAPLRGVAKLFH
jgi:sugar (pentulose or hexulose) kinase